jgi:hypothetical protein
MRHRGIEVERRNGAEAKATEASVNGILSGLNLKSFN